MRDLFEIYSEKIKAGIAYPHPHRWMSITFNNIFTWDLLRIDGDGSRVVCEGIEINSVKDSKKVFRKYKTSTRKTFGCYFLSGQFLKNYRSIDYWSFTDEELIADKLQYYDNEIALEVYTPVGKVDCESVNEIIEIKQFKYWKHALGQVLAYSAFKKNKMPRIHLFGKQTKYCNFDFIREICNKLTVKVTIEPKLKKQSGGTFLP